MTNIPLLGSARFDKSVSSLTPDADPFIAGKIRRLKGCFAPALLIEATVQDS